MALDAGEVTRAALRILDTYGLADLSMRRLADSLGVKAGALYWHVANKQTLLALVADEILAELDAPAACPQPAGDALVGWALHLREVLLAHRDSAELVATALASGLCRHDPLGLATAALQARGLGVAEARWGAQAVLHLVLGHVVEEQNQRLMAELGVRAEPASPDSEQAFGFAVRALVAGLAVPRTAKE